MFFVASTALLASGFIIVGNMNWVLFSLLTYCNLTGVFLVYRLNDCIDQDAGLKLNLRHFFSINLHKIILIQFIVFLIPLAFIWLSSFSVITLAISALIGTAYSLSITVNLKQYRIKNIFIVKNLFIGLAWGSLILIGAGEYNSTTLLCLFVFASMQVMIGSIVRDVPDLEKDKLNGVNSFPVVLGLKQTHIVMHLVNLASLISLYFVAWNIIWVITLCGVVVWRIINLVSLYKDASNKFWSQIFNLFTCLLIFIAVIISKEYGITH